MDPSITVILNTLTDILKDISAYNNHDENIVLDTICIKCNACAHIINYDISRRKSNVNRYTDDFLRIYYNILRRLCKDAAAISTQLITTTKSLSDYLTNPDYPPPITECFSALCELISDKLVMQTDLVLYMKCMHHCIQQLICVYYKLYYDKTLHYFELLDV
jgi:hypothetical protein